MRGASLVRRLAGVLSLAEASSADDEYRSKADRHGRIVEARPQNPFQRRMDLGEQTSNAVSGL